MKKRIFLLIVLSIAVFLIILTGIPYDKKESAPSFDSCRKINLYCPNRDSIRLMLKKREWICPDFPLMSKDIIKRFHHRVLDKWYVELPEKPENLELEPRWVITFPEMGLSVSIGEKHPANKGRYGCLVGEDSLWVLVREPFYRLLPDSIPEWLSGDFMAVSEDSLFEIDWGNGRVWKKKGNGRLWYCEGARISVDVSDVLRNMFYQSFPCRVSNFPEGKLDKFVVNRGMEFFYDSSQVLTKMGDDWLRVDSCFLRKEMLESCYDNKLFPFEGARINNMIIEFDDGVLSWKRDKDGVWEDQQGVISLETPLMILELVKEAVFKPVSIRDVRNKNNMALKISLIGDEIFNIMIYEIEGNRLLIRVSDGVWFKGDKRKFKRFLELRNQKPLVD